MGPVATVDCPAVRLHPYRGSLCLHCAAGPQYLVQTFCCWSK